MQISLIMENAWKLLTSFKRESCRVLCLTGCCWFFFRWIVYQIGKTHRNILALMSVLDYVCPLFRRPDQPVLPQRSEDVKCVPSQFLHRLRTSLLMPENVPQTPSGEPNESQTTWLFLTLKTSGGYYCKGILEMGKLKHRLNESNFSSSQNRTAAAPYLICGLLEMDQVTVKY